MMNKEEIIIDGVNVKDCKRRFGKNNYCRYFKRPCADNNFNCIWKQHKRLKEENATLREFLNQYQEEANALKSYETYKVWLNNEYRKENEKLKQYLLNVAMIIEELEQQYDDIKDFTEIKEIKEILNEVNQ